MYDFVIGQFRQRLERTKGLQEVDRGVSYRDRADASQTGDNQFGQHGSFDATIVTDERELQHGYRCAAQGESSPAAALDRLEERQVPNATTN